MINHSKNKIIRARAPLRLGLGGGGTDISAFCDKYGGYILNATIDMYAYATIETNCEDKVRFVASDREEVFDSSPSGDLNPNGFLNLHKGVYNRIMKDYNDGRFMPLTLTTFSDVPSGSGLGSSSTIVVVMLQAFSEFLNIPFGEYELAHLAYEIERIDLGLNGGKQDQYAAAFGGFNFMEFYSKDRVVVNPLRIKSWILSELETSLVLYDTGVSRESAAIIEEQEQNIINNDPSSIEAMQQMKENALRMKEYLLKGELKKFADCMRSGWKAKKKTAQKVSNSNIDLVYETARNAGALSGKISGAGGGGYLIFLVEPLKRMKMIKALNSLEGQVMGCHFTKTGAQSWKVRG